MWNNKINLLKVPQSNDVEKWIKDVSKQHQQEFSGTEFYEDYEDEKLIKRVNEMKLSCTTDTDTITNENNNAGGTSDHPKNVLKRKADDMETETDFQVNLLSHTPDDSRNMKRSELNDAFLSNKIKISDEKQTDHSESPTLTCW